jgi:plastocyanin
LPVGVVVLMYLVQAGVNSGNGAWIIIESLGGASQVAPATQSQHAAQLGQVQSYGGGFGGITPVSSTTSLTNGVSGQLIVLGASAAPTLPDVSTMTIGQSVTFTNQDSAAHTISAFGAQTIVTSGVAVPSLILQPGQDIVLTARSSSTWTMASGSGKFQFNGMAAGRLLRTTVYRLSGGVQQVSVNGGAFTSTGAGTFNSLSSTASIVVEMCGGGGGSAGVPSTGAGQVATAGGGGGAVYGKSTFSSGFSGGIAITVGAGGTGGAAGLNNGGAGGTTSFGALMTCGGGNGSTATAANTAPIIVGAGSSTTTASGVNVYGTQGGSGGVGLMFAAAAGVGGAGGCNGAGWPGPVGATIGAPGISGAASYGVGGSGGAQGNSGAALAGAPGGAGFIAVYEYA